jgi:hypothetical protein
MGLHYLKLSARAPSFGRPMPAHLILLGNLLWCALIVFSAGGVAFRIPIQLGYLWILAAIVVLALVLIVSGKRVRLRLGALVSVALFVLLILRLLWPYLFQKLFVSSYPDAWSYCAFAEYLARFPRGTTGGLQPLYQYSSYFSETRFGTSAILAFFGALFRTDAAQVLGLYALLLFSNVFWGVALLLRLLHLRPWLALCAGAFSIFCGLIPDTLIVGSLDNLLFLSVAPHLLARTILFARRGSSTWSILALAVTSSAAVYAYPEGVALFAIIFFPFVLRAIRRAWDRRRILIPVGSLLLFCLILTGPYLGTFFSFLFAQIRSGTAGQARVGIGTFPGFVSDRLLPSLFGAGEEFANHPSIWESTIFSIACLVLVIVGLFAQCRRRKDVMWSLLPFAALILWQGVILRYDYGLFKVMVLGNFLVIFLIFSGIDALAERLARRRSGVLALFCALLFLAAGYLARSHQRVELPLAMPSMKPFVELEKMAITFGGRPVLLSCSDDFNQEWAIYFLRDYPLEVMRERGYIAQVESQARMEQSKPYLESARYLLADSRQAGAIWHNQVFWLIARPTILYPVQVVTSPNGLETLRGFPFLWIGDEPVKFSIRADQPCRAILTADELRLGPSAPNLPVRHLWVKSGNEIGKLTVQSKFAVELELEQGMNEIEIRCEDQPTVLQQPNGDRRLLLLGLLNYKIEPR